MKKVLFLLLVLSCFRESAQGQSFKNEIGVGVLRIDGAYRETICNPESEILIPFCKERKK